MTARILFLGTPDVAVPPLRALVDRDDLEVVAVVTNPDRPRGRSRTPKPPPVKVVAQELGLPVLQPARPSEIVDELHALELDAAAVVAYGSILRPDVLAVPRHGFVNLHYSLLPRWRGAAPVQHAIRAGDAETGVTCFVLDPGMDTGPVLLTERVAIPPDASSGDMLETLTQVGAPMLGDAVAGLVDGSLTPQPQSETGVTLAPMIDPDDVAIDWTRSAREVTDLVRSADPRPGAHTTWRGDRLKVWRTVPVDGAPSGEPGELVRVDAEGFVVACGEGAVRLERLQPSGRPRQDGRDVVNGQRPETGERLGA